MNNDEIGPVGSAVAAIAYAIIDSFVATHSMIVAVIVTVAVLAVMLPWVRDFGVGLVIAKDLETGFHGNACPAAYLLEADRRRDVIQSIGGSGSVEPEETAGRAVPAPGSEQQADLEAFFHDHYRYFLVAAMALGATVDDAYEAVQAAVADMLERDTWSRLTRNPRAWVRKAVRHAYYDQQEKRRRSREIESLPPPSGSYQGGSPNVWEDWQWVGQMLSTLPPAQREVFELVLAELDAKEIADLLGKTPATIRQNLAHARRRLRTNLGKDYQIDTPRKPREEDTP